MREIVMNTGPVIALVAATGSLDWLGQVYRKVWIPFEVDVELEKGGPDAPEQDALRNAGECIEILKTASELPLPLANELDPGEASVIQTAKSRDVSLVVIDEKAGRRIARLHNLKVTGSVGVLIRARRMNLVGNLNVCIERMRNQGVWLSEEIIAKVRLMEETI